MHSDVEEVYIIEKVKGKKILGDRVFYLVKWEGYDEETWQPLDTFKDALDSINEYEVEQQKMKDKERYKRSRWLEQTPDEIPTKSVNTWKEIRKEIETFYPKKVIFHKDHAPYKRTCQQCHVNKAWVCQANVNFKHIKCYICAWIETGDEVHRYTNCCESCINKIQTLEKKVHSEMEHERQKRKLSIIMQMHGYKLYENPLYAYERNVPS